MPELVLLDKVDESSAPLRELLPVEELRPAHARLEHLLGEEPLRGIAGRGGRSRLLAARPPPPKDLAPSSPGPIVGRDRALRRSAEALDHGAEVAYDVQLADA